MAEPASVPPDVSVEYGSVPPKLIAPAAEGPGWQAEPGRFLWLGGLHSGRFLAEGGRVVTVEPAAGARGELLVVHLLDSVLAAIFSQRGLLVLHASAALAPGGGALVVCGESGQGKSTTVAALMARGCVLLADDITVLRPGPGRDLEVLPGIPQFHLTEDAAQSLGRDITGLPRFQWRRMKAAVPAPGNPTASPAPLRSLFVLQSHESPDVRARRLTGARKFAAVMDCLYGPLLPEDHARQFSLFAALTERIPVYRLERPVGRWTAVEVAAAILDTVERR